jgi:hypothetical protein
MNKKAFERRYSLLLSHFTDEHPTVVSLYFFIPQRKREREKGREGEREGERGDEKKRGEREGWREAYIFALKIDNSIPLFMKESPRTRAQSYASGGGRRRGYNASQTAFFLSPWEI